MKIKLLKDLCHNYKADIVDGPFGSNMKRSDYSEDGIPVLKIQNVKPFKIEIKKMDFVTESKYAELKRHSYKKGDIVMTKLGDPLGASAIVEDIDDGLIVADLVRIRAEKIDTKYLCYHLNSPITNDFINTQQKGATRPRVQISVVRDLPIYAPPLPEQQRIVAILDEAFAAIECAKINAVQNLKNAKELFDSYLQSVFENRGEGWEEKQFSELCDIKHGYAFEGEFFSNAGEFVLLTPGNFYETGGFRDRGAKQKYYIGQIPAEYVLKKGDLLVAMTEQAAGLLGSPILVPDSDKYLHNQRLGLVKQKSGIPWTNEFFFHVFNTRAVRQAIHNSGSGVKVRHTSPRKIGEVIVSYPISIKEQMKIVNTLQELSAETKRLEAIYQQKIECLEELKKSILQKAFNGELG